MYRILGALCALLLVAAGAFYLWSSQNPFALDDTLVHGRLNLDTAGLKPRSQVIDPTGHTLVLIIDGQSNAQNVAPTVNVPKNFDAVDQFNIYDGSLYPVSGPLLGVEVAEPSIGGGPGHIGPRLADKIIDGGSFNRVVIVPMAVGGTPIAAHATGSLAGRIGVVMRRLASKGLTPKTPGLYFAYLFLQGETDQALHTSEADYTAALKQLIANLTATGFVGHIFVPEETKLLGEISPEVEAAQLAIPDGKTIFAGGNLDAIGSGGRLPDNTHFNNVGQEQAAEIIYNSMIASGPPFAPLGAMSSSD